MVKKILIALSVIALTMAFINCSKKTTQPIAKQGTSTFPLTIGSRWEYADTLLKFSYIDSLPTDTIVSQFIMHIIGIDTLGSSGVMAVMQDSFISGEDTLFDYAYQRWLKIEDNKLKEFAFQQVGDTINPITIYDAPKVLLDYPLNAGKSWTVRQDIVSYYTSRVVGAEIRYVGNQYIRL